MMVFCGSSSFRHIPAFEMTKDEWGKVPKWKRTTKKKALKLF